MDYKVTQIMQTIYKQSGVQKHKKI